MIAEVHFHFQKTGPGEPGLGSCHPRWSPGLSYQFPQESTETRGTRGRHGAQQGAGEAVWVVAVPPLIPDLTI